MTSNTKSTDTLDLMIIHQSMFNIFYNVQNMKYIEMYIFLQKLNELCSKKGEYTYTVFKKKNKHYK